MAPKDDLRINLSTDRLSRLKCMECGHKNPGDVEFCTKCRAKMVLECADCGFKSPQGSEFCGSCGNETEFGIREGQNRERERQSREREERERRRQRQIERDIQREEGRKYAALPLWRRVIAKGIMYTMSLYLLGVWGVFFTEPMPLSVAVLHTVVTIVLGYGSFFIVTWGSLPGPDS